MMQPKNVVGVKEFWGEFDSVLVDLLPVLKSIALEDNLPESIRKQSFLQSVDNIFFYQR